MATSIIRHSSNNRGTGYLKMPDGTMFQWGVTSLSGRQITAITYPLTFIESNTVVSSAGAGSTRTPIYIEDATSSGFNAVRSDSSPYGATWFRWLAIGRWK